MRLLLTLLLLTGLSANAQPLWRNFWTTNQNPRVTVVAGSNATVQASTVGVDQRIFTVNGMPSGGDAYLANNQAFTGSNYFSQPVYGRVSNSETNYLGILNIGITAPPTYDDSSVFLGRTITQTVSSAHGYVDDTQIDNGRSYSAFDFQGEVIGTNDYSSRHVAVFQANGTYAASNSLSDWYCFSLGMANNGGPIGSWYGTRILGPTGSGTVSNKYGIYLGSITGATNDNYQLYFNGDNLETGSATARSYMPGVLLMGRSGTNNGRLTLAASTHGTRQLIVENSSRKEIIQLWSDGTGDGQIVMTDVNGTTKMVLRADTSASYLNAGSFGLGNASPQAKLDVTGDIRASTTITATNGIVNQGKHSFTTNFTVVQSIQLYNCNGTNQVITLPNCTNSTAWQIYRFSSTNGFSKIILTNANGVQTIRDGTSLSFTQIGIGEVGFYHDGAHWWIASKAKTILPVAQFSTSTNIPLTLANTAYPVTFNRTDFNNSQGIALGIGTNGFHSKMWITNSGQYEFDPSVVQSFNGNDTIRFWFRKWDTNIANSATPSKGQNGSIRVITVPFIVNVTETTPFEIWAESDSTGEELLAGSASGNYPAAPSVICPVKRVSDTWP